MAVRRGLGVCLTLVAVLAGASLQAQPGALDLSFDPGSGVDNSVYSIALQSDGKILIGGSFTSFNGSPHTNIARLNADGSLDATFNPSTALSGSFAYVNAVALQSGGKVLLAGSSLVSAVATNLIRLNTNGTLDAVFVAFTAQVNDSINALALQTNGSIVLGGSFTNLNGATRGGLARLSANGSLDHTYGPVVSGGLPAINALALQVDGKLLIAGSFTNVNGSPRTNIARLNSDGSLDTSFKPAPLDGGNFAPALPGLFTAVAVDTQGRVLAGGDFTSIGGLARTNLVRFNTDGSLDTNFFAGAGTDFAVYSLAVQSDGRVLVGGNFNFVNGVARNYLARLNADGTLDTTFNIGSGADALIYTIALQSDAKILIGGGFTEFNGTNRNGIARLQNSINIPVPILVNPELSNNTFRVSVATVSGRNYALQFKNGLGDTNWTTLPSVAGDGTTKTLTDNTATVPRRYYRGQVF